MSKSDQCYDGKKVFCMQTSDQCEPINDIH